MTDKLGALRPFYGLNMTEVTLRWPEGLRGALINGKQRTRAAGFRSSDPAGGAQYFEAFSDDVPTVWDFNLRLAGFEAQAFWAWFSSPDYCDYGNKWFRIEIGTEFGMQEVEAHFTVNGVPNPSNQAGRVFTYPVQLHVRDVPVPVDADYVVPYFERYGADGSQNEALDRAINWGLPEAN